MGASAPPGEPGTSLFGALPEAIAQRARADRHRRQDPRARSAARRSSSSPSGPRRLAAADRAAEESRAVPARVDRWFAEANFHHSEFADLARLTSLKEKQGLTVSLVLPTLNESETIGPIVRRAIREMQERYPLLDEILVIDSASDATTPSRSPRPRAPASIQHPDVLPRYGSFRGKGEALWKSLFETSGDIVVWADTDVRNWHRADGLRDARPAARRAAAPVRQGLLPAPDRRGRRAQGGRRRPGHRARRAAAHQPVLPRAVGLHPAAGRASTRAGGRCSSRSRSSPATRSRSATSSTPPSGPGSRAWARSTSSGGSTATRSSRGCRGCRSSSSRR